MPRSLILGVIALFATICASAEHPKPPIEAYGALPQISRAAISPDGTKVATIANVDGQTQMVVFALSGGILKQIGIDKIKARNVEFYDNDHVILRVSDTTRTYGFRGKYEYTGAFAINIETGDIEQLLRGTKDLFPAQSGLGRIVGRADKDGHVLMPAFIGPRTADPSLDLLRVKLESPRGRRYMRGSTDTIDWFVGDNGKVLARERYNNRHNTYRVDTWTGGSWKTVLEEDGEIPPYSMMGVMPDESGLVFLDLTENGFDALMKLGFDGDIQGPLIEPRDREVEAYYIDSNQKILGVRYAGVLPEYAFLDDRLQESVEFVSEARPNATVYLDSWSDDFDIVLYHLFDVELGDIWLTHQRSTGSLAVFAGRRPDIPANAIGNMFDIQYKARDGLEIQAILTTPPNYVPGQDASLPALIIPHGGPASYDRWRFDWMSQYFANRGYLVLQPNFRGSTGFGREFQDAGRGEWGGKMQDDITDGINALVTAGYIDPDRICIAGASYGGYAALAGATFTPDLYQCVVAIAPVSDLNLMLSDEKRERGKNHWVVSYWEGVMAEGEARKAKLRAISPYHFADRVSAPVLLLHGDDDTVVPISQSNRMKSALERADKDVTLIKLKGEDHWLSVADTRLQTLQAMDAFISEHLPVDE